MAKEKKRKLEEIKEKKEAKLTRLAKEEKKVNKKVNPKGQSVTSKNSPHIHDCHLSVVVYDLILELMLYGWSVTTVTTGIM